MTAEQQRLSRKYIEYKFLTNLWFVAAVWLYFYRLFITDSQVGILDGTAFAIGLIAEIPSGVLADRYGRDRMVKMGQLLAGIGVLIQAFGTSFIPFFIGQSILMIGVSFVSGADEALFFDKLKFKANSVEWRKLLTRTSQIGLIASLIAVVMGGLLHEINPRLPWIFNGIVFLLSAMLIWPITEKRAVKFKKSVIEDLKHHLVEIKTGFLEFKQPKLLVYVPLIISVQGLFYTVGWGMLRMILLDRFGFSPFTGAIAIASCSLITIGIFALIHKHSEKISEKDMLLYVSLSAVASLLLAIADIGLWGYIVLLVLYIGEYTLYPFMSEIINYRTSETNRATVLSVASFLRTLPYVVLAPIIGLLNTNNKLEYFFIFWSIIILLSFAYYLTHTRRNLKIALEDINPRG